MRFTFEKKEHDLKHWMKQTERLWNDLSEIAQGNISVNEAMAYAKDAMGSIEEYVNPRKEVMLFLMYDKPNTMPADARVRYVYKPTYIITSTLMTLA